MGMLNFFLSVQRMLECINSALSLPGVTGAFVNLLEHLKRCLCDFNISQSLKSSHFPQLLLECWGHSEPSGPTSEQMTALLAGFLGSVYQVCGVSHADISSVVCGVTG